ncbi:unnamed protein product [Durusdinium trenchii]|uniref:C3H1-type domain-containing protein n=1 Tax=Durusdinium trenchii TaxID=1381693 RepID=A0ABP0HPF7_9DINO
MMVAGMCEPAYVSLPPGLTQINHPQDTPWKVAVDPATVSTVPGEDVSESSLSHLTNWQPTEGSQGHPELCHRPCLFFARGSCQSGAECRYCHLDHSDRPAGLDKSQRQAVKQLSQKQLLALLLPHLQTRAEERGFLEEAQEILAMAGQSEEPTAISNTLQRKLHKVFRKMSFSGMLGLIRQSMSEGEAEELSAATNRLRSCLRRA